MANEYEAAFDSGGDYQLTNAYRDASRDERRRINRYKKELDISDEHMFLLMMERDLDAVPADKREGADFTSKAMIVVAVLIFWNSMLAAKNSSGGFDAYLWVIALVSFGLVIAVYYTGALNPYKRARRKLNKRLKEMPEVESYDEWCKTHPIRK